LAGQYIAIEGNIGAGKSTLARLLSDYYKAPLIPESFAENLFLPLFYKDAARYALPLELSFLAQRYKQLTGSLAAYAHEPIIVADYIFLKSSLFAGINLEGAEYDLFQSYFDIVNAHIPNPDVLIFLDAPVDVLLQNIHARGRAYEQNIKSAYLERIQHIYNRYIDSAGIKTIVVDRTAVDFLKQPDYIAMLAQFINNCKDNKIYHFSL